MVLRRLQRARAAASSFALPVLAATAMVVLAGTAACHRMPLTAPSGSALTLIASANVVPVDGQADITAVVLEGAESAGTGTGSGGSTTISAGVGTPVHDGTHVTFTTTLGHIEPADAETTGGRVTVKLVADGRSGTATITAFSGPASNTLDVDIGAAAATRIAVTASPQSLPANGGTSTIGARVEDQQGNGLAGVPVSFSTTKGTLSKTTVTTDDQGSATTVLTTTAEATVTASAGGSAAALSGTVTVTLAPRTTITLTPPASATVGVPAVFTLTPGTDSIIDDVTLDFGDGSRSVSLGAVTGAETTSHLYPRPGVFPVTARATSSSGDETTVGSDVAVGQLSLSGSYTPSSATTPQVNTPVVLTVTPASPSALIDHYEWRFDDGSATVTSSSNSLVHTFPTAGTAIVTVLAYPVNADPVTVVIPVSVKP